MQPLPSATPQPTAGGRSSCCPFPEGLDRSYGPLPSPGQGAIQFRIAGTIPPRLSWLRARPGPRHGAHEGRRTEPAQTGRRSGGSAPGCGPLLHPPRQQLARSAPAGATRSGCNCADVMQVTISRQLQRRMMLGGGIRPSPSRQSPSRTAPAGGPSRPPLRLNTPRPEAQRASSPLISP